MKTRYVLMWLVTISVTTVKCLPTESQIQNKAPGIVERWTKSCYGFRCKNGPCLPSYAKCNGVRDCTDNSDETDCPCGGFICGDGKCLKEPWKRCDGITFHCADHSDEKGCETECKDSQFKCPNGLCKPAAYKCDRMNDCGDNFDEEDCDYSNKLFTYNDLMKLNLEKQTYAKTTEEKVEKVRR